MTWVGISYPQIPEEEDAFWLADLPLRYDALTFPHLLPHFTFIFPFDDETIPAPDLVAHCREVLHKRRHLRFCLRGALFMPDYSTDEERYYVFLVPDEGMSAMIKLHDQLYTGILKPHLRYDIPFIPHITVGYTADLATCKAIVDEINATPFDIKGRLDGLWLSELVDGIPQTYEYIGL